MNKNNLTKIFVYAILFSCSFLFARSLYSQVNKGRGQNKSEVKMKDDGFEKIIRRKINKETGPIYQKELKEIKKLQAGFLNEAIKSLKDFKHLPNLKVFRLSDINLISINKEHFSSLKSLKELELHHCGIQDISFIKGVPQLEKLSLVGNNIKNIEPIKVMSELKYLDLTNNKIEDLSPLKRLNHLKKLFLSANPVINLSPITGLKNLVHLELIKNDLKNVKPLKHITSLKRLDLSFNKLNDITPLFSLKNLRRLSLEENEIQQINRSLPFHKLEILDLSFNKLKEIPELSELSSIKKIKLHGNPLNNVNGLQTIKKHTELSFLSISFSEVEKSPDVVTSTLKNTVGKQKITLRIIEERSKLQTLKEVNTLIEQLKQEDNIHISVRSYNKKKREKLKKKSTKSN